MAAFASRRRSSARRADKAGTPTNSPVSAIGSISHVSKRTDAAAPPHTTAMTAATAAPPAPSPPSVHDATSPASSCQPGISSKAPTARLVPRRPSRSDAWRSAFLAKRSVARGAAASPDQGIACVMAAAEPAAATRKSASIFPPPPFPESPSRCRSTRTTARERAPKSPRRACTGRRSKARRRRMGRSRPRRAP